ncbi:tetratricopeptide repeat protein, partial [Desulfothermus sp.]
VIYLTNASCIKMQLIVGILCLLLSIGLNSLFKWRITEWATSPLPYPEAALLLSGEFSGLSSDYFLVKAALFYGSKVNEITPKDSLWLAKDLNLSSYLDPYYFEPYWMAGIILPWEGRTAEAKQILKRGLKYLKNKWEIPFYLGFISFYFEHNNQEAAHYFFMAAKMPGAPAYLPFLASRLAIKGGETNIAISFLETQLKLVRDEKLRKRIEKRVIALRRIAYLEKAVAIYRKMYHQMPHDLKQLVKAHIISAIPTDPYGGSFYITKEGKVWTTSNLR